MPSKCPWIEVPLIEASERRRSRLFFFMFFEMICGMLWGTFQLCHVWPLARHTIYFSKAYLVQLTRAVCENERWLFCYIYLTERTSEERRENCCFRGGPDWECINRRWTWRAAGSASTQRRNCDTSCRGNGGRGGKGSNRDLCHQH